MPVAARDQIARLLLGDSSRASHVGRLDVPLDRLRVRVDGVGDLRTPIPPAQAKQLRALGTAAPFGLGEQTLTDREVRDTWQLPLAAVGVDWDDQLDAVLHEAREVLGLAPDCVLAADLHSALVYERGQFFAPHQDSEKEDSMVATLVVTLPCAHTGGELVVHDGGRVHAFAGSRTESTAVVFYADRLHEVRPVRTGHRISLTFNISIERSATGDTHPPDRRSARVADLLGRHFNERPASRWPGDTRMLPTRLAYLLDHQYTQRGLGWSRLKGSDQQAATLLRDAASVADCEIALGLVDIHEQRSDDGYDDEEELLDSEVVITHLRDCDDRRTTTADVGLGDHEVCASVPTSELRPYNAEHEGYMGNYGNTVDRWYRRTAVVVWPRRLAFANAAEATPGAALEDVVARLGRGDAAAALADVRSLKETWPAIVAAERGSAALLHSALRVAALLDDSPTATMLLDPFDLGALEPDALPDLGRVAARHGERTVADLVGAWAARRRLGGVLGPAEWIGRLPQLVAGLGECPAVAERLVTHAWSSVQTSASAHLGGQPTSRTRDGLDRLGPPLAAVLRSATSIGATDVRDALVGLCAERGEALPLLLSVLRAAEPWEPALREGTRAQHLATVAAERLCDVLDRPERSPEDWSLAAALGCDCELCRRLSAFLSAPGERTFEWPLAAPKRQHVHARIDVAELPVSHRTRRSGRPFTLVLTKTATLHDREEAERQAAVAQLAAVEAAWLDG